MVTSGKVLWTDKLLEKVLGNVRLFLIVCQPIPKPESQHARLLRMFARIGADKEYPKLQREGGRFAGALLAGNGVLVNDDARMIPASDMDTIVDLIDELPLDEYNGAVGRFATWRHHDLLCARRRLTPAGGVAVLRSRALILV